MATLTGKQIANTYKDLLQVSNANSGIDATVRAVSDGEGTESALQISNAAVNINGTFQLNGDSITKSAAQINNIADLTGKTGLLAGDGSNVFGRTLVAGQHITIGNADGQSGNPTIAVSLASTSITVSAVNAVTGTFSGIVSAAGFVGPITGDVTGDVTGTAINAVTGDFSSKVSSAKVNGTNATFSNIVSATTFDGNLIGNVTGNVTGDLTGDVDGVNGSFSTELSATTVKGNIGQFGAKVSSASATFTDIVSATTFDGNLLGNITGNVTGDVTGNVDGARVSATTLIAGDNLYLNSDDSVIYFGADNDVQLIHIPDTGLRLPDGNSLQFGSGPDLSIHHDGSHSYISDSGDGGLIIQASQMLVKNAAGTQIIAAFDEGAASALYYNNSGKLATTTVGVDITGNAFISDSINLGSASDTTISRASAGTVTIEGSEILTGDGSGNLPISKLNSGTNADQFTFWRGDGQWAGATGTAGGSVTSVAVTGANGIDVTGSPITAAGTIALSLGDIKDLEVTTSNLPLLRPSLSLNFARAGVLDPRITFTRASTAMYYDSAGTLQTALANVARFDHDPATGEALGFLVEGAATNLCLQSEDLTTTWFLQATNPTLTANSGVAPDGTSTADKVAFAADAGSRVTQDTSSATSGSTKYTFSVWARYISGDTGFRLFVWDAGGGDQYSSEFTATSSWVRHSWTFTYGGGVTRQISLRCNAGGDAATIEFWGAMLEAGEGPSSYAKTTTVSVTRSADIATLTDISWYDQNEGTILAEADTSDFALAGPMGVVVMDDETLNNLIRIKINSNAVEAVITAGGSTQSTGLTIATTASFKAALAYAENDFAFTADGAAVVTDTSGSLPTVTRMLLGKHSNGYWLNGHLHRIAYYPKRITNTQLQALTE